MINERDGQDGRDVIRTRKTGIWILNNPSTNQGMAFSPEQRHNLRVRGMLPYRTFQIEDQLNIALEQIRAKSSPLEQYIGLASLQDRNEVLFYRLLVENMAEFMPIVYTPTVGEACQKFSHVFRNPRGIWLTPEDIDNIPEVLRNAPFHDVRLIVVTDNERILGLGDQGCGGIGIPIGKLALYVAGAGIHPSHCLPISLDVGTNNPDLLDDPLYAGYPHRRLRGKAYDEFIEAFVQGVKTVFPRAVIQWEDFHKDRAFTLLDRYRRRVPCFNDDIEGTASVTVAGVLAALRVTRQPIAKQRIVLIGAGEACTGIARLIGTAMRAEGASEETVRCSILAFDSKGLLHDGRTVDEPNKVELTAPRDLLKHYGLDPAGDLSPTAVIRAMKPTVLIGATAKPGAFTEEMITEMAKHVDQPVIMPLSNPNSKAECAPKEAIAWTNGRALVASGSPFADVTYEGRRHVIGQANNVFVFPGVGLGAIVSEASEITEEMFFIASRTLAEFVSEERLASGALYPHQSDLREVSFKIACEVVRFASENHIGKAVPEDRIEDLVRSAVWHPAYAPVMQPEPEHAGV
ncbi:MAG: NAD-dependent malic enzyme [Phycisphaerales bacterium]|nr:NAD-dependent malic enzyme [Phycisphaerales bacterium]